MSKETTMTKQPDKGAEYSPVAAEEALKATGAATGSAAAGVLGPGSDGVSPASAR